MTEDRELVEKLLKGQAAIDAMKAEIRCVISMMLGLAYESQWRGGTRGFQEIESSDKKIAWKVFLVEGDERLRAECWELNRFGTRRRRIYWSHEDRFNDAIEGVAHVHAALPVLVRGLMDINPALALPVSQIVDSGTYFSQFSRPLPH